MKTKTYTRSKVTLFIGLISLHTLSSCVHTGRQLDMKKYQYSHVAQGERNTREHAILTKKQCEEAFIRMPDHFDYKIKNIKKEKHTPVGKKKKCLCGIAISTLATSALGILYFIGNPFSGPESITNTTGASIGNGTTAVGTTQEPFENLVNTTAISYIANATADVVTTLGSLAVSTLPGIGLVAATLKPHAVVLPEGAIDRLDANHYSKASIEELLLTNANVAIHGRDKDKRTLLMHVAQHGDSETVQHLIERGAQVDAIDEGGNTAIMFAALAGKKENVKILLKDSENPCLPNKEGQTAEFFANIRGHKEIIKMLAKAKKQKCS